MLWIEINGSESEIKKKNLKKKKKKKLSCWRIILKKNQLKMI
jgi:hypothetical protein